MGSPRVDVVFRLWQCDKENHGWREGPPLTVPWQSFDLLAGPSPSRQNQLRTKKEYSFAPLAARSSIRTLAGLKRLFVHLARGSLRFNRSSETQASHFHRSKLFHVPVARAHGRG